MGESLLVMRQVPNPINYVQGLMYTWTNVSSSLDHAYSRAELESFGNPNTSGVSLGGTGVHSGPVSWGSSEQWVSGPKPSYLPSDYYSWKVEGYLYAPETGTYRFGVDGDDAVHVIVDDVLVADYYGPHGFESGFTGDSDQNSRTINLIGGQYYTFEAAMHEYAGGDGIVVGWEKPSDSSINVIPAENFFRIDASGSIIPENALFYFDPNNIESYSGSGTTLNDLSDNGNNFTLNGVSFITDGDIKVFDFNSSGDSINGSLDLRRDWSFEAWVKIDSTNDFCFLGQGPTSSRQGLHIWYAGSDQLRFGMYSNDTDINPISTSTGVWYQYVFTYDHQSPYTKKIYRNGLELGNRDVIETQNSYIGTGTLRIGQIYSSGSRYTNGKFSEMIMYNKTLSDAEVLQSFNDRKARYGL